jgi:hypothetical protein
MSYVFHYRMRDAEWKHVEGGAVLTPRGQELADEVAKEVPRPHDYIITMTENETMHVFKVRGNQTILKTQIVCTKKVPKWRQYPYHCNCSVTQVKGVPCHHVVAIAKSTKIEELNLVSMICGLQQLGSNNSPKIPSWNQH